MMHNKTYIYNRSTTDKAISMGKPNKSFNIDNKRPFPNNQLRILGGVEGKASDEIDL